MVAKGTGRWVYFSFSGGSSPPPAAGTSSPYSPSTIVGRKALRFVLLCSRLVKKVLTSALSCSNYCCAAVIIVERCGSVCVPRTTLNNRGTPAGTRKGGRRYRATRGSVRRLLTLGQPHRNTAIRAHLQSRSSLALLVVLVLCLFALILAANEAWAKEQPSPAAQQGPAEGKNTPNGQANGKVAEPVSGTPTPSVTTPVAPPASQGQPAVTPPVQTPPVENAPPPPKSETPPAEKPSSPPLEPAPSTPEPDPAPQPTPLPVPQAGGEEDVESSPVPNTSQPPTTGSDRVVEPEPVSTASPNIVDEVVHEVIDLAPDLTPAPATPATVDEGRAAGSAPDLIVSLPAPAAAAEQVLPAASEGLATLVRGLVSEPATAPATTPITPLADGGPLTTITKNKPAAAIVAAAVPAAPAVGEALRLSSSLGTGAAGALGSTVGTVQSAAARAATSVVSATAEVFRTLAGGSALTSSSTTDATSGTQQAPSDVTSQDPVVPFVPPLGDSLFSPFTGAAGQLAGGGVAPLLVGILALLTTILIRRDFRTYLIACELPKPSSALLLPLERPG